MKTKFNYNLTHLLPNIFSDLIGGLSFTKKQFVTLTRQGINRFFYALKFKLTINICKFTQ